MLLHEDQTELGKSFFQNAAAVLFFLFFFFLRSSEGAETLESITLGRFKSFLKDQQTS